MCDCQLTCYFPSIFFGRDIARDASTQAFAPIAKPLPSYSLRFWIALHHGLVDSDDIM